MNEYPTMDKNETADYNNSGSKCSRSEADAGDFEQIPVTKYSRFKRRKRFVSVNLAKETSFDRNRDLLILGKSYSDQRWYEAKAVKDLIQTLSFYNGGDDDYEENDYDDDKWSCPQPKTDNEETNNMDYDDEICIEDIPVQDSTNSSDKEFREPCLFSIEYFKMKWKKLRNLIDYCYPALTRKKEYYLCPYPCCPSRDPQRNPQRDGDKDQPDDNRGPNDHGFGGDPGKPLVPVLLPEDPKPKPETIPSSKVDNAQSEVDVFDSNENNRQSMAHQCCSDDDFWTTLFQILILAPLLAFTAYLFVQWYKVKQEYKKKLGKLNKVKRDNDNLISEINRLDAFVMSCQMSPIVCTKRQRKLADQVRRICQSLKNHKEKIKELEQDRAIYREVLWNLKTCA